jgi:hypothetical protein
MTRMGGTRAQRRVGRRPIAPRSRWRRHPPRTSNHARCFSSTNAVVTDSAYRACAKETNHSSLTPPCIVARLDHIRVIRAEIRPDGQHDDFDLRHPHPASACAASLLVVTRLAKAGVFLVDLEYLDATPCAMSAPGAHLGAGAASPPLVSRYITAARPDAASATPPDPTLRNHRDRHPRPATLPRAPRPDAEAKATTSSRRAGRHQGRRVCRSPKVAFRVCGTPNRAVLSEEKSSLRVL